jgi:hypothetical protein
MKIPSTRAIRNRKSTTAANAPMVTPIRFFSDQGKWGLSHLLVFIHPTRGGLRQSYQEKCKAKNYTFASAEVNENRTRLDEFLFQHNQRSRELNKHCFYAEI